MGGDGIHASRRSRHRAAGWTMPERGDHSLAHGVAQGEHPFENVAFIGLSGQLLDFDQGFESPAERPAQGRPQWRGQPAACSRHRPGGSSARAGREGAFADSGTGASAGPHLGLCITLGLVTSRHRVAGRPDPETPIHSIQGRQSGDPGGRQPTAASQGQGQGVPSWGEQGRRRRFCSGDRAVRGWLQQQH